MANVLCPKCRTPLEPSGELVFNGQPFAVYQCDKCVVPRVFRGKTFDVALTFAIDQDGKVADAETGEPLTISPPSTN